MRTIFPAIAVMLTSFTPTDARAWTFETRPGLCSLVITDTAGTEVRLVVSSDRPGAIAIMASNPSWQLDQPKTKQVEFVFRQIRDGIVGDETISIPADIRKDGKLVRLTVLTEFSQFFETFKDSLRFHIRDNGERITPDAPMDMKVYSLQQCAAPKKF